jgi:hypothetical protein
MSIYTFGSGTLWGVRTDVANATPVKFGTLQDVSVEFSGTNKTLHGQNQFPVAVARGESKVSAKAKIGQLSGLLVAGLFFGVALSAGQVAAANGEAAAVPAGAPYEVTVANGATFVGDLGITDASTGLPFTRVAAAPAEGQYIVDVETGKYTFAAADTGKGVIISYTYTIAATGQKFVITNQEQGVQPVFRATLETKWTGPSGTKKATLTLNACVSSKLGFPTKQGDFGIPEFDFDAFADEAGNIGTWSFSEAS